MEGLSRKTILWRAFSQSVIFFYLMDEETSLLVLIPAGVGALIEIWKVTKAGGTFCFKPVLYICAVQVYSETAFFCSKHLFFF